MTITEQIRLKLKTLRTLVSENGCDGPCVHGTCLQEDECEECHLDPDSWCLACHARRILREICELDGESEE